MDASRKELSRLLTFSNPHAWCLTDTDDGDGHRYYFLDQIGTTEHGETALHRLMACHCSPTVVSNFLRHRKEHGRLREAGHCEGTRFTRMVDPPDVAAQTEMGATALHVAVYRNSWHVEPLVAALLDEGPRLASIPMSCGSYPLHVMTGHNLTIQSSALELLLRVDPTVVTREDESGDNPLSLLWKNVLRFRWARYWEFHGVAPDGSESSSQSWMTVISPNQFRDYALRMIACAPTDQKGPLSWCDVVRMPRCPPLLIRMLLQRDKLIGGKVDDIDAATGDSLLHVACGAKPVLSHDITMDAECGIESVTQLLLDRVPEMARKPNIEGRYPLHIAVSRRPIHAPDIVALVDAYPSSLSIADPLTSLYPAQQLAANLGCDTKSLDLLFAMLVANPGLVSFHR